MAKDNRITLYDLQLRTGATISPFVWATKYAIAHKGFEIEGDPEPFSKAPAAGGLAKRNTGPASTREETERLQARMRDATPA